MKVRLKKSAGLSLTKVVGNGDKKNTFVIEQDEEKEISDELFEELKDSLVVVKEPDADEKKDSSEAEKNAQKDSKKEEKK